MRYRSNAAHEVRIYIGGRRGYKGLPFNKHELVTFIHQCQSEAGPEGAAPVRVADTTFVWAGPGESNQEAGFEIAVVNYPRQPKPVAVIDAFALGLANSLLMHFEQQRISVVFPNEIVMLEADDPEEHK